MNTGIIYIPEAGKSEIIGSDYDEVGNIIPGVELLDVIAQVAKFPDTTNAIEVRIKSPGGVVTVGDAIYDYLDSLKKKYVVNTVQVGLLGSIATKIFMVGQDRKRDPRFSFIIHNPWNNPGPGDSKYQADNLEGLLSTESALRKFYMGITGLTEEAISPLMDAETDISPEHSIALKFATSLTQIPVMAKVVAGGKKLTWDERITAFRASITGNAVQALDLELADGSKAQSDAVDMTGLEGSTIMINGAAPADGDLSLKDGTILSVSGGKVAKVTAAPADPAASTTPELAKKVDGIEAKISDLTEILGEFMEANKNSVVASVAEAVTKVKTDTDAVIAGLRKEIGTTHTPKPGATVYSNVVDKTTQGFKTISQRMAEKNEARQKSNNKV